MREPKVHVAVSKRGWWWWRTEGGLAALRRRRLPRKPKILKLTNSREPARIQVNRRVCVLPIQDGQVDGRGEPLGAREDVQVE